MMIRCTSSESLIDSPLETVFLGGAQMNYVRIDHHRQYSHMTLMDEKGNVVTSGKAAHLRSEVEEFLEGVKDSRPLLKSAVRATCWSTSWMS